VHHSSSERVGQTMKSKCQTDTHTHTRVLTHTHILHTRQHTADNAVRHTTLTYCPHASTLQTTLYATLHTHTAHTQTNMRTHTLSRPPPCSQPAGQDRPPR